MLLVILPWKAVLNVPVIALALAVWTGITSLMIMANVRSVPIGHCIACSVMVLGTSALNVKILTSPKMGHANYVLI